MFTPCVLSVADSLWFLTTFFFLLLLENSCKCKLYRHSTCARASTIHTTKKFLNNLHIRNRVQNLNSAELFYVPSLYCNQGCCLQNLVSTLLSEVSELNASPPSDTAKGWWLDVPVLNRVGKQTDGGVQVFLDTGCDGTEVIESHTVDFVAVEKNYLNRQRELVYLLPIFLLCQQQTMIRNSLCLAEPCKQFFLLGKKVVMMWVSCLRWLKCGCNVFY